MAIFNLLQKKSIVFPDIAYSTERLSTGQKFELFVDNSVSVNAFTWSLLGSAVGQADNSPTGWEQGWDAYGKDVYKRQPYVARQAPDSLEFPVLLLRRA